VPYNMMVTCYHCGKDYRFLPMLPMEGGGELFIACPHCRHQVSIQFTVYDTHVPKRKRLYTLPLQDLMEGDSIEMEEVIGG
jgi:DNA-directed RNA polymerase subunit RPC12/RpoP